MSEAPATALSSARPKHVSFNSVQPLWTQCRHPGSAVSASFHDSAAEAALEAWGFQRPSWAATSKATGETSWPGFRILHSRPAQAPSFYLLYILGVGIRLSI
jgi:hypothetical protein